jgi:tetratricopeptide (TPR) repeat protein
MISRKLLLFSVVIWSVSTLMAAPTVASLLQCGKAFLESNQTDSAVVCFEKVLELDPKNYDALVYLCNYHFLIGQKVLDKVETVYLAHESPTRMQVAQYNEDLVKIYKDHYSKAEKYLIEAYLIRRNDHLDNLAGQIADFKERIGMRTPGKKKVGFIGRLLP